MSEKLLPIVPGCQALVIGGALLGRTVTVSQYIKGAGQVYHNGRTYTVNTTHIAKWACIIHGAQAKNDDGVPCEMAAIETVKLMRIDGSDACTTPYGKVRTAR